MVIVSSVSIGYPVKESSASAVLPVEAAEEPPEEAVELSPPSPQPERAAEAIMAARIAAKICLVFINVSLLFCNCVGFPVSSVYQTRPAKYRSQIAKSLPKTQKCAANFANGLLISQKSSGQN